MIPPPATYMDETALRVFDSSWAASAFRFASSQDMPSIRMKLARKTFAGYWFAPIFP